MLKRTHLWFLASVLFSQGAIAGTDLGYELNTNALESTPATPIADDAVKIKGRPSGDILSILGFGGRTEMVHRDDLVVGRP